MRRDFAQRLDGQGTVRKLVVTDNQGQEGAAAVGPLHLRSEASPRAIHGDSDARDPCPKRFRDPQAAPACLVSRNHQVTVRGAPGLPAAFLLHQFNHSFEAHGPTDCRSIPAAQLSDQSIVASAGADGALGAQAVGHPFEDGTRVVIQAAHEPRVDPVLHPGIVQQLRQALEVRCRAVVEITAQHRRPGDQLPEAGILAVEDSKRVPLQTLQAVGVQHIAGSGKIVLQRFPVIGAAVRCSEGIEFQARTIETQPLPDSRRHDDDLGIHFGAGEADGLQVDLVELSVTRLLGALVTKHRAGTPQLLLPVVKQAVTEAGPNHARGCLRAKGHAVAASVREGVHFLLDDIGGFADGPAEQFGALHDRKPDPPVSIGIEYRLRRRFHG